MAVPLSVDPGEHAMARLEAGKGRTGQGPISQKWILPGSNVPFGPQLHALPAVLPMGESRVNCRLRLPR